jgi:hypothetical protein
MKDNELYTFFKERSSSFDETPADALWAKIEAGLNNKPEPVKTSKPTTLLYIIGSLLLVCGILAYFAFGRTDEPTKTKEFIELPAQITPIVTTEEIPFEKPTTDTVKKKKTFKALNTQPKQEVPFRRIESQNGVQERAQQLIDELFDTDYKTDKLPGRTIVTVKGKISTKLFQKLIEQTLEKNQKAYGDVIIVKAFGHKTFRKVIKIPESEAKLPTNGIIYRDSSYIRFMPSKPILTPQMLAKDSLEIEYIHFKDTEPKATPQKTELKNDKLIDPQPIFHGTLVTDSVKIKQDKPVLNAVQP